MRKYTTLVLPLIFLLSISLLTRLSAQTNNLKVAFKDAASAPRNLNICGDEVTVAVTVSTEGVLSATRQSIAATLNLFKGVQFVRFDAAGSSAGVTYSAGANGGQAVFGLPNLTPVGIASVNISYVIRVNCEYTDSLTRNDQLDARDSWNFRYTLNGQALTETDFSTGYRDQIKVPFFTMSVTDNTTGSVRVGQCFQRKLLINNSGLDGYIKNFVYTNSQAQGIYVSSITVNGTTLPMTKVATFNATNDTLIRVDVPASVFAANTIGPVNPANGNLLFESNETVTIIENFCVVSCDKARTGTHTMSWGCDNRYCNSIARQTIIRLGEGAVNVAFSPTGTQPDTVGGYCKIGKTSVIFRNNGVEVDPGTAAMMDIVTGIGLGNSVGLADKGFKITKITIAGLVFNTPSVAIQDLRNSPRLTTDPDGVGVGLADIDGDGFFDDLPVGKSIEIKIEYEVECGVSLTNTAKKCVNDFETAFNAQIDYTDVCNKRNSVVKPRYFAPLNVNDLIENCTDPDCGTDSKPFMIQHKERRNIFNFDRSCGGQEEILVKVKLPTGVLPIQDSMRLLRYSDLMRMKSMTQSNDTVFMRFDIGNQTYINGDYTVNFGFKATCAAQTGLSGFPVELSFVCPPCGCQHVWYCDTIQGPKIHYFEPPCVPNAVYDCPKGLKTTGFTAVRTTLGYTNEKYTTKIDPSKANLKAAMSCDSIQMTVKNVVGTAPLSDSLGIRISYENITFLAASKRNDIFKFGKGTVRIVKGSQVFTCAVDSSKVRYVRTDSAKYMYIDFNHCFAETGIAALNKGDSVNFIGNFTVEDNGPFKNTFEKIPRLRAYGYHTDNATEFSCDDFGETFRVGRPASVFAIPNSSNFPKGCTEAVLDYKVLIINNGYYDIFSYEHRKSVGVDSILFTFDPLLVKAFKSSVSVSIPDHPFAASAFYPLSNLDSTGRFVAKFDTLKIVPSLLKATSYAFDLRIKLLPNCSSLTGSSLSNNTFKFNPKIYFRDRYYALEIGDGSCSPYRRDSASNDITYSDPPALSFTPVSNPATTTVNDTATWTVKLCNTSDKGNAGTTFFSVEPDPSVRSFKVVKMTDITNAANRIDLTINRFGRDSLSAFAFTNGLTIAGSGNTLDDVCNIVEIKATTADCGTLNADFNAGWNCVRPTESTWSPALYPPCTDLTIAGSLSIEAPFLDGNFINQSLSRPSICDTTTLEILLRNTDLGKVFDVRTRITVPLEGADLALANVEVAYPPSAPYQRALGQPRLIGANARGRIYEFADFSTLNNYLNINGLKGSNPNNPNDSNDVKIRFRFSNDCDFKSGSLSYFSFAGKTSCGTPANNELGESLPIQILGAEVDTNKLFSVGVGPNNRLVPGGTSTLEIFITNLTNTPSTVNDNIQVKLPEGITYQPNTSVGVEPLGWTPAEPTSRIVSGFTILEWKQPVGLVRNQVARLRFGVVTADTFSCNGGLVDIGLATMVEKQLACPVRQTICRVETITTSDGEQFFPIPLSTDSIRISANLTITNGTIQGVRNQPITLTAIGATAVRWLQLPSNAVLSTDLTISYTPTEAETTIRVESISAASCLALATIRILTDRDTAPPTISVRDTTIGCRDTFPLIYPIVSDDVDTALTITYIERFEPLACGQKLIRTWTATDDSGKSATAIQTITQTDTIKPIISPRHPLLANVRSGDTLTFDCQNPPNFGADDVTATDNCTDNVPKTFVDVAARVGVCSRDGFLMLMECDWRATDACGNTGIFKIFVKITDNTPPAVVNVPADITVNSELEMRNLPQGIFGRDRCDDDVTVTFEEQRINDTLIYRIWTAADDCQNIGRDSQIITIRTVRLIPNIDTIPPQYFVQNQRLAGFRNGDTLRIYGCDDTSFLKINDLRVTDNRDSSPRVRLDSSVRTGICNIDGFITLKKYRWTATDSTGNAATFVINLKLKDTIAPVFSNIPADITLLTNVPLPSVVTPTATDNCSSAPITLAVLVEPHLVDTLFTRVWTAVDACGNQTTARQTIRKFIGTIDRTPPTIQPIDPLVLGRQNGDTLTFSSCVGAESLQANSVRVTDNTDRDPSVQLDSTTINGLCPTTDFIVLKGYTWTATDSSGNRSTFRIWLKFVDDVPPVVSNVPADVTISATGSMPIAVILVTDACSSVFVDSTIVMALLGIDTVFVRTWIATDLCGNLTTATQTIMKLGRSNNSSSTVWVGRSDTARVQLFNNQSDTVCLRKRPNSGGYTIRNICPDSTTRAGIFEILRGDTCVVVFGVEPGRSTACFQVCDSTGVCDTTVLTVFISRPVVKIKPIAMDDNVETRRGVPIDIQIAKNDTLSNFLVNSISMMTPPDFGTATIREKGGEWTVTYQPDSTFCSAKLRDEFYYELCTDGGCARAFIRVKVLCDGLKVFNAFSPNEDGHNDVFFVEGLDFFPNTALTVYNRWGNSVYSSKDYKNDWTGTFNGNPAPDGTYFYIMRLENGESFTGYVQIQR